MAPSIIDHDPAAPAKTFDPSSTPSPPRALIGNPPRNYWLHSPKPPTFDLTRPAAPDFPLPSPAHSLTLSTTTSRIILSPTTTALVIIDMQDFFISTCLGRPADGAGNLAGQHLLSTAIPAARKAGIRIIWLNWGLTDEDITNMPPSTRRAFGFEAALKREAEEKEKDAAEDAHGVNQAAVEKVRAKEKSGERLNENGKPARIYKGLGSEIGPVTLEDGSSVDAGRLLMRDTWNASLPPALLNAYREGTKLEQKPDIWIHKNRMSGLWGAGTPCTEFLEKEGITSLLFTGVNTDQCVSGSLQDAFTKGYDCVLVKDGCGTTSPKSATEGVEFNCARTWGFVTDCKNLEEGVEGMLGARMGK